MSADDDDYPFVIMDGRAATDDGVDDALILTFADSLGEARQLAREYGDGVIFQLDGNGYYYIRVPAESAKRRKKHRRR